MWEEKQYYVYILASQRNGTLYTGVTNNLQYRIWQHKQGIGSQFTTKYKVHTLVYYEIFSEISQAIYREKQIKRWRRNYKLNLIEEDNPTWRDLYEDLVDE